MTHHEFSVSFDSEGSPAQDLFATLANLVHGWPGIDNPVVSTTLPDHEEQNGTH